MVQPRFPQVTLTQAISAFVDGDMDQLPDRVVDYTDEEGCDVAYLPLAALSAWMLERSDWHVRARG